MERADKLKATLSKCWVPNGGMNRAPDNTRQLQQNDDYYGLGLLDVLLDTHYAAKTLDVSRTHWGILNNVFPGEFSWKSWLFRMPQLRTHLQMSTRKERPGPLGIELGVCMCCGDSLNFDTEIVESKPRSVLRRLTERLLKNRL